MTPAEQQRLDEAEGFIRTLEEWFEDPSMGELVGYADQPLLQDKIMKCMNAYADRDKVFVAGYRAGIERAAKVCDEATQQAVDHIAEVGFDSVVANVSKMESSHLAGLIRDLLDEPQEPK